MAEPDGILLGYLGKAYYLSSGTRDSWGDATDGLCSGVAPDDLVELTCIRNITDSSKYDEADGSTRAAAGYKIGLYGRQSGEFTLAVPWQPADTGWQALRAAYYAKTTIAIAILDGDSGTVGVQGVWADFNVLEFPREEPEDKEMLSNVKISYGFSAVAPQAVQVAAGS